MAVIPDILVVEDDEDTRWLVADALGDNGYHVLQARHGAEALRLLEGASPSAILLDIRMPVMDGVTFARTYRGRSATPVPIIVMTGEADAERFYREIDADATLRKPFHLLDLVDVVRRCCRGGA